MTTICSTQHSTSETPELLKRLAFAFSFQLLTEMGILCFIAGNLLKPDFRGAVLEEMFVRLLPKPKSIHFPFWLMLLGWGNQPETQAQL